MNGGGRLPVIQGVDLAAPDTLSRHAVSLCKRLRSRGPFGLNPPQCRRDNYADVHEDMHPGGAEQSVEEPVGRRRDPHEDPLPRIR